LVGLTGVPSICTSELCVGWANWSSLQSASAPPVMLLHLSTTQDVVRGVFRNLLSLRGEKKVSLFPCPCCALCLVSVGRNVGRPGPTSLALVFPGAFVVLQEMPSLSRGMVSNYDWLWCSPGAFVVLQGNTRALQLWVRPHTSKTAPVFTVEGYPFV
jgi:hypothetical protein